jgi:3-oxoacyl-[acyl-carrier-protein] synthase II
MTMRKIVITGMGAVCPLGLDVETAWRRLLAGESGVVRLTDDIVGDLASKIAGVVTGFDADSVAPPKEQRKMDRFILFALAAAEQAIRQAGWSPTDESSQQRTATVIASCVGGVPALAHAVRTVAQGRARRLSPFTVPSFLANLAAGHISIRHGFKGPMGTPVTACAAGVQAIGDAARLIRNGEADVAICGGAESCVEIVTMAAFAAARALATQFNDSPQQASRPFDVDRDGFVMGEGAGVLVIEALDHALARGAKPIAEVVGYGTTTDAYHITSGLKDGDGARRAMQIALSQGRLAPSDVQHMNAHGTSTLVGDQSELEAVKTVFGREEKVAVSSTKSATGHLLGAAGGLEAIFTILALRDQVVPATLNLERPDAAADGVRLIRGTPQRLPLEHAMSNGFGFGGVNASVVFRRL